MSVLNELNDLWAYYLGKRSLTQVLCMGQLSAEERPIIGQLANEIRDEINTILNQQGAKLKAEQEKS